MTSSTTSRFAKTKAALLLAGRTLIAAGTMWLLFQSVQWSDVVRAFRGADLLWVAGGFVLLAANLGTRMWKWHEMVSSIVPETEWKHSAGSFITGITLGSVTPGELGEFVGRTLHLPNAKRSHLVGLTLLDRFQIMFVWGAFGGASLLYFILPPSPLRLALQILVVVVCSVVVFRPDVPARIGHRLNDSLVKRPWATRIFDAFTSLDRPRQAKAVLLTISFHLIVCIQAWFFLNAFEPLSVWWAVVAISAVMFAKALLPISLADLGIREMAAVYFFGKLGVSSVAALNASLLLFVVNIVIPGLAGGVLWWQSGFRRRKAQAPPAEKEHAR